MKAPSRFLTLASVALACLLAREAVAGGIPEVISLTKAGIIPEGIEYDARNRRFLVGSIATGTVFEVASSGETRPFVQDAELRASIGIEVDEARNRLLVANADFAVFRGGPRTGLAKLGIYDLTTGARIAMLDLAKADPNPSDSRFANDIAVAQDGVVYVTDTTARVIYRVDANNVASVLLPNRFQSAAQFMFNGIETHRDGYLLVAETAGGDLYRVPLANPDSFSKVKLAQPLVNADGLLWDAQGRLLVVLAADPKSIVALRSEDNWVSATIDGKASFEVPATTVAMAAESLYVVHPYFNDPKALPFIERVRPR